MNSALDQGLGMSSTVFLYYMFLPRFFSYNWDPFDASLQLPNLRAEERNNFHGLGASGIYDFIISTG